MNAKERFYSGVARETIKKVTSTRENWTSFLTTMARNYEFTYPEQIMIYAQRPNAVFCKPYDEWNNENYRRYVKRGSTGIALFVMNRDKPYLRYVFDIADTGVRHSSPELKPWEVTNENRGYVMEHMGRTYGVKSEGLLEAQLEEIAQTLAAEYWNDHNSQFLDIIADSYLEEYDELNIEVTFKTAVATSVSYAIYSRLVENPDDYFEHEDFLNIFDFNSRQTVNALGTAVNAVSSEIFREMEKAIGAYEQIKSAERSVYDERNDLQTGWGLSDSGYETGESEQQKLRQVWQDAEGVSGTEQSDALKRHDPDRNSVSPSVGDRGYGERQSGTADEAVSGAEPGTRQRNGSAGLGKAYEQPESTGGGNRDDGAYQQLSLNLFPSENEQISFIDRAESFMPSAFSFSQEEIDHFLLLGSNTDEARKIVALEYMKQKSIDEIIPTLKQVYHGGYGLKENSGNISAWYGEEEISLARGSSALNSSMVQILSWSEAAERIGELLESGQYAMNVELEEAAGYERLTVAQSIWYLYHDLSDEAKEMGFFPSLSEIHSNSFPEETAWLAEQLSKPEFLSAMQEEYREFITAHDTDRSLLRFHYHKLNTLEKRISELDTPLREYQSDMIQMPLVRQFITDDEINADLARGSGFAGGKRRIYEYWQEPHSTQDKADFLKHEFGTGGHSHACSNATNSGQDHDAKGVRYSKSGCDQVQMSWLQVAQRIDALIKKGRYLTPEEEAERKAMEEAREDISEEFLEDETSEISVSEPEHFIDHSDVADTIEKKEIPAVNFHITDDHLGEGGSKQKFANNIAAIETLFKLEREGRNAAPAEQEILSKYVGWGGLADAFDPDKESWASEYAVLKNLLSEEEYAAARASTLNAHYTSPTVIRAIYDAVSQMGFENGNILEPSMGIGNFFGMLPPGMQSSRLYGVELDSITGRIAQKLYPHAEITVAGFETTDRRDFYDLAVGNVPFGNYKVSDKPYDKLGFSIHNYFFAKALDQVRPGGILAFVTSRYTLDSKNSDARRYLAQRAELLGAIRLPNDAFKKNAGAEVVSDIIFLQKRDHPIDIVPDWVHLNRTEEGHTMNSYLVEHPEMVLGDTVLESTPYGKNDITVKPLEGADLSELLKKAVSHIRGTY